MSAKIDGVISPRSAGPAPDDLAGLRVRRASMADAEACHDVLWESVTDLGRRQATPLEGSVDEWWGTGASIHRHVAEHAAEWWLAEEPELGRVVGYARSIEREGLLELTEFFVRPSFQARGLGRVLIDRAFPPGRGAVRSIIATGDVRALTRYHRAGTLVRFPLFTLGGSPSRQAADPRIQPSPIARGTADVATVRDVERAVLGFARGEADIDWLLGDREGWLYRTDGVVAGFAFIGASGTGPIGALDPASLPAILDHVAGRAHTLELDRIDFQVPAPNETAMHHLLDRGFRLDPWINYLMSDHPFGRFDRFIGFGPPMFL